jgi:hypothetical protein
MTSGVRPAGCDQTKVNLTLAKMRHSQSLTRTSFSAEGSSGKHAPDVEVRHTPYKVISFMAFDRPPGVGELGPRLMHRLVHWEAIAHQYTRRSFDFSAGQSGNPGYFESHYGWRSPVAFDRLCLHNVSSWSCIPHPTAYAPFLHRCFSLLT